MDHQKYPFPFKKSMEALKEFLGSPKLIASRQLSSLDAAVQSAIKENPEETIHIIADFMCNPQSQQALQGFAYHSRDQIKKVGLTEQFNSLCQENIIKSFWETEKPNFFAALNISMIQGNDFLFEGRQIEFAQIINKYIKEQNEPEMLASSKLIEAFFQFSKEINTLPEMSDPLCKKSSTFSLIISSVLSTINSVQSFDIIFAFLRSVAVGITKIFEVNSIITLFNESNSTELKRYISESLNQSQYTLLLSLLTKFSPENYQIVYLRTKDLISEGSSPIERVYGYTAIQQIVKYIVNDDEFINLFISCLFRDIDSSNNMITSTLQTIMNSIIKFGKQNMTHITHIFLSRVACLPMLSKMKAWLLPQLLPYADAADFDPVPLIAIAQNQADSTPVTKCIRAYANTPERCILLVDALISFSERPLTCDMPSLKPILDPLFERNDKQIPAVFERIKEIKTPNRLWVILEALRSSVRSRWPLTPEEVFDVASKGLSNGNWDIRVAAFEVCRLAGIPSTPEQSTIFENNFENLLLMDSPRHTAIIASVMDDTVDAFANGANRFPPDLVRPLLANLWDKIDRHMVPAYISEHRKFALLLANSIFRRFPDLDNDKHRSSLASLLMDPSCSSEAIRAINQRMKGRPDIEDFYRNFPNEKVVKMLFDKIVAQDIEIPAGIPTNSEEISDCLGRLKEEEDWEKQCDLMHDSVEAICCLKVSEDEIVSACESIFEHLMATRKLGVTCRGQKDLERAAALISPSRLSQVTTAWTDRILSVLGGFDMENMRRSAALPYLALSIIRLQPPDVMAVVGSNCEKLISALLRMMEATENPTEATNGLNVVRAILTDKVTSPVAESILPGTLVTILRIAERLGGWEVTAAANLCLSAVIRKACKKNMNQGSQQTLALQQFLVKMPGSKAALLSALNAGGHAAYLAITVLIIFDATETDRELRDALLKHIDNKDSRFRRTAARAVIAVTAASERPQLFNIICQAFARENNELNLEISSYNMLHGLLSALRILAEDESFAFEGSFPLIDFAKIPPFCYGDLVTVLERCGLADRIPDTKQAPTDFYFDEAALLLRKKTASGLSDRALTAMVTRRHTTAPPDLAEIVYERGLTNECAALTNTGLDYASLHLHSKTDYKKLHFLIKTENCTQVCANLVHLLVSAESPELKDLMPLFTDFVFNLSEAMTPVHISIGELLPQLLKVSSDAVGIGLRLLIDEIPKVRVLAMVALSDFFKVDFAPESVLIKKCLDFLKTECRDFLLDVIRRWTKLIHKKIETDTHGEQLTVLVDEFFLTRVSMEALEISYNFNEGQVANIVDIRKNYIRAILDAIEKYIE